MIVQITDPHIGARWTAADPLDTLARVLEEIGALPEAPEAILVTGDLANDAADEQYAALADALRRLGRPVHVLPGNHDDRARLREHFDVGGIVDAPVQYAVTIGSLRVLMLDTTVPGRPEGELDAGRIAWLARELAEAPEAPTLVAMHHPPFVTGLAAMDAIALPALARDALTEVLDVHPQVRGLIAGHVHRAIVASVAGRPALTIPSTYCQAPLDFAAPEVALVPGPLAFAVHALIGGRLVSHVQTLAETT